MKILMASTMALGALCILALNQPAKAEISSNDPNFHLPRGGGHGAGGRHMGHMGGGHSYAGHGGHGYGHGYRHGYGYGGWGTFCAGVATGAAIGALGTTVYENNYSNYPAYEEAPVYNEGEY